jgi:hypothetical protein
MAKQFLVPLKLVNLSEDPSVGTTGELYLNTATGKIRLYVDGAWGDLTSSGGGGSTGLLEHSHSYDGTVVGVQTTIAISFPNLDGGSVYNIVSAIGNVDGGFPESFYSLEASYDGGVV